MSIVIVVATADFEAYHGLVAELRQRDLSFTTVEPGSELPDETDIVIAVDADDLAESVPADVPVVRADADAPRAALDQALARLRESAGQTIVGVDPGTKPGIAILSGERVVAAFQVPLNEAPEVIQAEVTDALDPLVKIGDGARREGAVVVEELDDIRVEVVDETGTTPHLGRGARGMGDVLAAVNIARLDGEETEAVGFEPTAGEIQVIQNRSREETGTETLPTSLAREVAKGDLTMDEAIARHRDDEEE